MRRLRPLRDLNRIHRRHQRLRELLSIYERVGRPTLRFLPDVRSIARQIHVEGLTLSPEELWTAVRFFDQIDTLVRAVRPHRKEVPSIYRLIAPLPTLPAFRRRVRSTLTPDGEVLESASPELRRISHEWRQLRHQIAQRLRALVSRPDYAAAIQDTVFTQREHRWVLLVRADQRHRIPGIVLGTSGSGASVYLEPLDLIEWNNRYVMLEQERRTEVYRVLQQLTEPLRRIPSWPRLFRRLAILDALLAIAAYAITYNAHIPKVTEEDTLTIRRGRHPLLLIQARQKGRPVVPLDVHMGPLHRVLVITGPNAGGKTVALKTVGLLTLMALAGLPIPADSDTVIPVFSHVLADIGDQQDLAADISTFASHIRRITPMLTRSVQRGLFLIDELGTGTDPVEGTALGRVIITRLKQRPGKVLVVTHMRGIQTLALQDSQMTTASMEFDPDTGAPTFRLVLHTLGASHALEIAERVGMPAEMIEEARRYLDPAHIEWTELLRRIEATQHALEEQRAELERRRQVLEEDYRQRLEQLTHTHSMLLHEWQQWKQRVEQWLQEREQEWHRFVQKVENPELRVWIQRQHQTLRRRWENQALSVTRMPATTSSLLEIEAIRPGQSVRIRNTTTQGIVEAVLADRQLAIVQVHGKRMHLPLSWLEPAPLAPSPQASPTGLQDETFTSASQAVSLLGLHVPEAMDELDRALDRAYRQGLRWIRVIHGYRPGRLKQAVLRHLRHHPLVAEIEPASPAQGGPGATIVYLRTDGS